MASSYVNDLRLNEMATGDASGTWGDTTNTNLELIAEAFSYGTEAITTNADTHTTTIADGATDPGRSLYLKYTGTLDSACTITIGPNTVSKVWIIENGTSGSQDIILSQGSGANITIPAGDTKVVYSDGAGAGAAFFDAFASLSVVDLKVQDDLTVTGDIDVDGTTNLDVVDIDGAVDMASTALVTGVLTANGGAVFNEAGADVDFRVESDTVDHALFVQGSDGFVGIGTSSPAFKLEVESSSDADLIQIQSTASANNTVLRLGISGDIATLNASGGSTGALAFKTYGTERLRIDSAGNLGLGVTSSAWTTFTSALEVPGGALAGISANQVGVWQNCFYNSSSFKYKSTAGATLYQQAGSTHVWYNAASGTAGDPISFTQAMTLDASGNVGIGQASDGDKLHVLGQGFFEDTRANGVGIQINGGSGSEFAHIGVSASNPLTFQTADTERMRIASNGHVLVNTTTDYGQFVVETNVGGGNPAGLYIYSTDTVVDAGNVLGIFSYESDATAADGTYFLQFKDADGVIGSITSTSSSSAVAFNTSSDERLKENIIDASPQLDIIKQVQVREFDWKKNGNHQVGMIAQELNNIIPEVVTVGGESESENPWAVDYGKLTPYLIKAMQEQQALIESLTARITTLEG
jgi:hypothetical protein